MNGYLLCPDCGHHGPKDDYRYFQDLIYADIGDEEAKMIANIMRVPFDKVNDIRKCERADIWECPKCKANLN